MFNRLGGHLLRRSCRRQVIVRKELHVRQFSIYNSSKAAAASIASPLSGLAIELDRIAPRFEVPASQITVIDSPAAFYETLKSKIKNARKRIYLSTLYIGKTEFELVETIKQALRDNPDLKVSILTDALRGTRETPDPSCASLLASLVAEYGPDRVEIRMFHTPNLTGLRKKLIPRRINEGWGLQHMKLYGIDDEIILSGANLSNDYFTNRLDRYHLFSSKELTDYYATIHYAVCSVSFKVLPNAGTKTGYDLIWPDSNGSPSPLESPHEYKSHASKVLGPLIRPPLYQKPSSPTYWKSGQTLVYPVAQFTPLLEPDMSTEFPAVTRILEMLGQSPLFRGSRWLFTAGYFNIHPMLSSLLVASTSQAATSDATTSRTKKTQGTVLTASPWANGFYGSSGVSGMLPAAYTHLSARFLDQVAAAQRSHAIQLKEWRRGTVGEPGGWTYHAKGLWITLPQDEKTGDMGKSKSTEGTEYENDHPSLTFVGSSNYTKRSYSLDLEVGAVVITCDEALKRRLGEEMAWLQRDAKALDREDLRRTERRVTWRVRLAMWIVEKVGGAL